ncbi:hypothetical protein DXG03_001319 [Asterophora parasitica]|uniref:adenosine deaminase n=1 Tax=Asterophora parasitica TaxID=117018 RepID=A0A9P7G5M7_9AGAR|nr:hypothetical protein DXG03_001319 [Asterophora parasitica]
MASSSTFSGSDLEAYNAARAALINEDRALRRDRHATTTSDEEQLQLEAQADLRVRAIRAEEAATIWTQEHENIPHPFPGMEFLTGREIIVKTKLFEILSRMPKGALLHCHLDATVNAQVLLKLALEQPALHVRVAARITHSTIGAVLPEFRALPRNEYSLNAPGITDELYQSDSWVSLANARANFDVALGGPEGFDRWVIGSMMINPTEAYKTHNTIKKVEWSARIWEKFQSTFIVSTGLIRFAPIFPEYIRQFFRSSIEDGISYVEARINFLYKHMVGEDGLENIPHRDWLIMFDDVLNEVKVDMKAQGREDEFIGARIIYSTIRFITPEELEWYLEDCIELKKEFPHLIAGFDLVGDENELKPLIDYMEPLLRFRQRQKEEGVDIPFIFHAGETLGDGTPADNNLFDAILLGTKRIGHGYSLVKHPKLIETCRQKGIAVEVCPISNEILVLVASELTGLSTLGQLARDSIEHSTLEEEEKQHALHAWERQWQKFISGLLE